MFCSNCGSKVDPNHQYCTNCGEPIKKMNNQPRKKSMFESIIFGPALNLWPIFEKATFKNFKETLLNRNILLFISYIISLYAFFDWTIISINNIKDVFMEMSFKYSSFAIINLLLAMALPIGITLYISLYQKKAFYQYKYSAILSSIVILFAILIVTQFFTQLARLSMNTITYWRVVWVPFIMLMLNIIALIMKGISKPKSLGNNNAR